MAFSSSILQEELSVAYIHALATAAGYSVQREPVDEDGVDLTIIAKGPVGGRHSPRFLLQAKCTYQGQPDDDGFHYDLKVGNYNSLRIENVTIPRVLAVLHVPEAEAHRIRWTPEDLTIRNCAFWLSLKGQPETQNAYTVAVHLRQRLSVTELQRVMGLVAVGTL